MDHNCNKSNYAKGVLLHQWINNFDFDYYFGDFVVVRLGDGHVSPGVTVSDLVDRKYAEFVEKAYHRKLPVIAWYAMCPRAYQDSSWPVNDYSRWADRKNDYSMQVIDRMLATRKYFHGLIVYVDVNPDVHNKKNATPTWVVASMRRLENLFTEAYNKPIWFEFEPGIIDNVKYDPQKQIDTFISNRKISYWSYEGSIAEPDNVLILNKLRYTQNHFPTFSMPSRLNCFWRFHAVKWRWDTLPVYVFYNTVSSMYRTIGFSIQDDTTPPTPPTPPTTSVPSTPPTPSEPSNLEVLVRIENQLKRIGDTLEKILSAL